MIANSRIIDDYFKTADLGEQIVDVCRNHTGDDPLWVSTGCALVEQESFGKNIFGADWGTIGARRVPYAHLRVTPRRVRRLLAAINDGKPSNGVGVTQLTYPPLIREAEALGGAHVVRNQLIVGFNLLNNYLKTYDVLNAFEAYNDGNGRSNDPDNPYDLQLYQKARAWSRRLNP